MYYYMFPTDSSESYRERFVTLGEAKRAAKREFGSRPYVIVKATGARETVAYETR